ncbi:MAG: (2Fe-2S)-binding protein [Xanthobacteraceae bacterium]|jgi:bacterioferritin-associated ferredoxin
MIVCSCNVLSDHEVRIALGAEELPRSTGQIYGCLGCSVQCGRCARTLRRLLNEATAGAQGCNAHERS